MPHHLHMHRLDKPTWLTLATLALLALVLGTSVVLGIEPLSLVVGAAAVALAFALVVVLWFIPARRARRRELRRSRRKERAARKRERRRSTALLRRIEEQEASANQLARGMERRLLNRLEARDWLTRELDLPRPLPPTRSYAASPDLLLELVLAVDRDAPAHVLELGSGLSSLVIARRLEQHGRGQLVSLDHDPGYAEATRAELAAYGVGDRVRVLDAPLTDVELGGEVWPWYALGAEVPERIDLLVVDGPPGLLRPQARYPALPVLRDRLSPGASVLLDDTHRADEREIVRRWLDELEGLERAELSVAHDVTMLVYRP